MPESSGESIEQRIVERFLDTIESDDSVSGDLEEVIRDLSSHNDFGGRDRIEAEILDIRGYDED